MKKIFLIFILAVSFSACKKSCPGGCGTNGLCNENTGKCDCKNNYTGEHCETAPLPPCELNHYGNYNAYNNNIDPYFLYVNGTLKATVPGYTYLSVTNTASGYYSMHWVQASGYLIYPTVYDNSVTVYDCNTTSCTIP